MDVTKNNECKNLKTGSSWVTSVSYINCTSI